jgi:iron complex outermembrane recepter protein
MISRIARSGIAPAIAIALGAVLVESAYADTQSTQSGDQIQEVVVTATKRATNIQETAASITAVSAEDIAARGVVDFDTLAQSVPGISMRTAGPGQTEFEMRGLNSAGGNTSQVGLYLDETPLSSPAAAQVGKVVIDPDLYDLSRVEVLRGPQGTLYGSSSMGGTVKLVPNPPQLDTFAASGEDVFSDTTSGGGINHAERGMVNLPIGDTLAVRIVGSITDDSGWVKRLVIQDGAVGVDQPLPGGVFPYVYRPSNFYTAPLQETVNGANTTEVDTVRAAILWKPSDALTITPSVMWQNSQQGAPSAVDVNDDPTHPTVPAVNAHWEIYDTPEPQTDNITITSLKIEYQLEPFTITSATGNWHHELYISQDSTEENAAAVGIPVYDAAAGGLGPSGPGPSTPGVEERDATSQFTQELRLTSNGTGPLQWLVGYFYQDLNSNWDEWAINPQATPILGGENLYIDYQPQVITQNAQFGQLSWQATDQFSVTAGLRHYHYSLAQTNSEWGAFTVYGAVGNSVPYNTAASNDSSGTDPKFDLRYEFSTDLMVYATASKGFRLGGVNQPIPVEPLGGTNSVLVGNECSLQGKLLLIPISDCKPGVLLQAPSTFSSDSVWNYEVGEKATLLDRRLTVDVSGYYERWTNPQIATNLAGFGITANGADARIYGLEGELQALLGPEWDLSANVGYTNAEFTAASRITGYPEGYSVPDIPDVTASAVLRWKHEITSSVSLVGTLEGDYVGSRTDAPYGETITLLNVDSYLVHLPAYGLVNLHFGPAGDNWNASLFIDNLTNKEALLDPQPQIDLQMAAYARYLVNQPRTIGLDVNYKFH